MPLETREVQCPYCGEPVEVEIELREEEQSFIEDCTVCCRPIQYTLSAGTDDPELIASRSD